MTLSDQPTRYCHEQQLVEQFARQHDVYELSVTALARYVGLSKSEFTRRFTAKTGQSPGHAVKLWRVRETRRLLMTSELTLKEIAHCVGVADISHLSRSFRMVYGLPPGQWRHCWQARLSQ